MTEPGRMRRFHRGDRVVTAGGVGGIVEGWKGPAVLVYFGTDRGRDARSWVPVGQLTLQPEPVMMRDAAGVHVVWPGTSDREIVLP